MQLHRSMLALLMASSLIACGGGNLEGGSNTTTPDVPTDPVDPVDPVDLVDPVVPEISGDPSYFTYVGASPEWISIKGTGGFDRKETGTVTFKLVDDNGEAVISQAVIFELSGPDGASLAVKDGISDSDGLVTTLVKAGSAAGPVTVKVIVVSDPTIFNTSTGLYISTGYPDQGSFSIGVDKASVPGINHNDATVTVTVNFADADGNNPIPDGTAVSFRAESGRIEDKLTSKVGTCTTVSSACVMTWTSIGDMPVDGKVTILAYALGVESFEDVNPSNGIFDEGETYTDNAEVFHDTNFDSIYNDGEWFHDVEDASGAKDQAYTYGDGNYTGMQCDSDVAYCDQRFIHIYKQTQITTTTDEYQCGFSVASVDFTGAEKQATVTVEVSDMNNNTPAVGTVITASTTNGAINGDTSWTVPNANGAYSFNVELSADDDSSTGSLVIKSLAPLPSTLETKCILTIND